jgi:tungstate transport system ATP-binding protein
MLEELVAISRGYDGIPVIKTLSMKVRDGQVLSIIGPNGAGKTTLLRMMALLEKPTDGAIYYKGKKVDDSSVNKIRGKVTMVFQRNVNLNKTVFKNVAYGLELKKMSESEIERSVVQALDLVGMKKFANRHAKKLSGGEQQRLAIARALVLEPELLLLDEPTANLDPKNTLGVERIINEIKGKTTVVVSTNNPYQAGRLSDRIACLLEGRLISEGTPKEIVDHPRDARIKKFVRGELIR